MPFIARKMSTPEIIFILYKPAVPGNVGASARAIKTMGFSKLRLIDPCDHLGSEARMFAHGSHEILEQARVFSTFREAVQDIDLVICTTAKSRSAKVDYIPLPELTERIREKGNTTGKVAILFGTEESGLPNELIRQSDLAMTIPMATSFPSLNLSQAVMVTAYELAALIEEKNTASPHPDQAKSWKELKERSQQLLIRTGIEEGTPLFHRIMERIALMGETDINLLHSVTARLVAILEEEKMNPDV